MGLKVARYGKKDLLGYQYYILKEYSDQTGRPQAYYIRDAIDCYLKENAKEIASSVRKQNLYQAIKTLSEKEQEEIPAGIEGIYRKRKN